jgi:hypothetical protein
MATGNGVTLKQMQSEQRRCSLINKQHGPLSILSFSYIGGKQIIVAAKQANKNERNKPENKGF